MLGGPVFFEKFDLFYAHMVCLLPACSRADDVLEGVKFLRPIINEVTASLTNGNSSSNEQDPLYYEELPQADGTDSASESLPIAFAQRRPQQNSVGRESDGHRDGIVRVAPPASANQREFTMLRLLDLSDVVLQKLLSVDGLDTRYEDIPFRCGAGLVFV